MPMPEAGYETHHILEMIRARMSPGRWQLLNIPWILLVWVERPRLGSATNRLRLAVGVAVEHLGRSGGDIASYRVQMRAAGFHAENAQHHLAVDFGPEGVEVRTGETHWRMTLRGYGHRSRNEGS